MRETHIRLEHLAVGYNGKALIHGIEIGVGRGEIVTLVGPNGSGKSTILKSITRQLTPVDGAVLLADPGSDQASDPGKTLDSRKKSGAGKISASRRDSDSGKTSASRRDSGSGKSPASRRDSDSGKTSASRRDSDSGKSPASGKMRNLEAFSSAELARQMAVVLTGKLQTELMTCRDVTAMGRYPYTGRLGILSEADEQKVDAALQAVHAQTLAERPFDAVSDGERQRILLARAICQEPEIIVLDEPTSYLDIRHKLELLSILYKMSRDQNITVVMSLHEVDLAMKISDRVVCVRGEEIFACGKPEEVLDNEAVQRLYDLDPSLGWFDAKTGSLGLRFAETGTEQAAPAKTASAEGTEGPDTAGMKKTGIMGNLFVEETGDTDTAAGKTGEEEKEGKEATEDAVTRESIPRVLLAAPASGSGKTLVTCGLLRLLQRHQLQPAAFKCGPDYIDPMFHRQVLGIPSRNLDTFFSPDRSSSDSSPSFPKKSSFEGSNTIEGEKADRTEPAERSAEDLPHRELSPVLSAGEILARAVRKYSAQTAVIEGVMGYFDGTGADGMQASARDLAVQTQTPVVLIVNAKGMSRSIVPLLQGFLAYEKKDRRIRGVFLNRISAGMYPLMKKWIEEDTDLQVLGWLPQEDSLAWGSRHLGLLQPEEVAGLQQQIDRLADRLEETLDLDALLAIARSAPPLKAPPLPGQGQGQAETAADTIKLEPAAAPSWIESAREAAEEKQEADTAKAGVRPASGGETADEKTAGGKTLGGKSVSGKTADGKTVSGKTAGGKTVDGKTAPRIAVARDEAFSFYYEDNLELLQECGAELVFFSPLHDRALPGADGLLLGGGYPELHARALTENSPMRAQIRAAASEGMPILAECGGFMYLQEFMETFEQPGAGKNQAENACRPGARERAEEEQTEYPQEEQTEHPQEGSRKGSRRLPMCGVLPGTCRMTDRLVRFGYLELVNRTEKESVADRAETAVPGSRKDAEAAGPEGKLPAAAGYLSPGHTIRGHEFHYFDSTENGDACTACKPGRRRSWNCMVVQGNIMAGFPHLYYRSDPAFAQAFVDRCRTFAQSRDRKR